MMRGNPFTQWWVFGMSSHAMVGGSSFTQRWVQCAPYSWPVTFSMVGPVEVACRFSPQRIILPIEVVTVSTYIRPIALPVTTQLELTLDIPSIATSPIDRVPTGASWSTSMSSDIFKQAITPVKPHGGVGGLTNANAFAGGEGSGREGAFGRWIRDLTGVICESRWDLPLGLEIWVGWGISLAATTCQDGCSIWSHLMNFTVLSLDCGSCTGGVFGTLVGEGVVELFSSTASGMATPQKTSSSVKIRYHFTSSLSSSTLFANKWGSPPVGRSFCSAQYWRALAYATTFSLGTSLMSQLAKIESGGSIKLCQCRHGWAGEAWRVALPASSSCSCCGSPKDTLTCLASFLVLSSPGTVDSSIHQLGVSHLSTFHGTHSAKSKMAGSGGILLPSSSDVSGDPCRKEATAGFSSGSSPKLESLPSDPSPPDCMSGLADQPGDGLSAKLTWWHIFLCPSPLDPMAILAPQSHP